MNSKNTPVTRKRRVDRNHIIYALLCVNGESYIGLTVSAGTAISSVRGRFNRHLSRAKTESKDWNLCNALRIYGREGFTTQVLEVVRGKPAAHARERELIAAYTPTLNSI